jgi:hypothetical protein
MLDEGRYTSISERAEAGKPDRRYVERLLQLTLLAPDILGQIAHGRDRREGVNLPC